jgi:hypothetical protein
MAMLSKLIGKDKVVQIDAFPLYKRCSNVFSMDDVPEVERNTVARDVADKIVAILAEQVRPAGGTCPGLARARTPE